MNPVLPAELFWGGESAAPAPPRPAFPQPFTVTGQYCEDCAGCEFNGYKDEFIMYPQSIKCGKCGHMVCGGARVH